MVHPRRFQRPHHHGSYSMLTSSRLRKFRPTLDLLPTRLTPSDIVPVSPLDPVITGWVLPPATPDISPLDPVINGWVLPSATPTP